MSRWENEGIVYKRIQNWTKIPHGDECIHVLSNLGTMMVRLNYEDEGVCLAQRINEEEGYKQVAYFPIEELEEIVGHMKNTMKRRQKQFEEQSNDK